MNPAVTRPLQLTGVERDMNSRVVLCLCVVFCRAILDHDASQRQFDPLGADIDDEDVVAENGKSDEDIAMPEAFTITQEALGERRLSCQ
jgi:hypothetical protein